MLRKSDYGIREITYHEAMECVVKNHYLHRKSPCSSAWGLYRAGSDEMVGVVVYGTPSSGTLRAGICGPEHAKNVIELTRLWIKDGTPKNAASFLVGNTLKMLEKEIVVSFADTSVGHIGYVYQATNWIYTGLSAKRTNWSYPGSEGKHSQTVSDTRGNWGVKELREKWGDQFKLVPRPRKHRYVTFVGPNRKKLRRLLRYEQVEYPKGDTTRTS